MQRRQIRERYIVFIRNNKTGEELVATRMYPQGCHQEVVDDLKPHYPQPMYQIHTAYTEDELQSILDSMRRWCGDVSHLPNVKQAQIGRF